MRIVFCDDNIEMLHNLENIVMEYFLQRRKEIPEFASYSSGELLIEREKRVDIAFLDVEMPGLDGIRVGAQLKEINPRVMIFVVTSHLEYLDDAMRLQSFRYVIKPIDKKQMFANLDDAMYQYNTLSKEIAVYTPEAVVIVSAHNIVCVEGAGHYTNVYTVEGVLRSKDTFGYWSEVLCLPSFFKIHRSYIINMRYVSKFDTKEVELKYADKKVRAKMSRKNYSRFIDSYFPYLERIK